MTGASARWRIVSAFSVWTDETESLPADVIIMSEKTRHRGSNVHVSCRVSFWKDVSSKYCDVCRVQDAFHKWRLCFRLMNEMKQGIWMKGIPPPPFHSLPSLFRHVEKSRLFHHFNQFLQANPDHDHQHHNLCNSNIRKIERKVFLLFVECLLSR